MASQTRHQIMAMHILKDDLTMESGQLIEYEMKNHTQNLVEKLVSDTFIKS